MSQEGVRWGNEISLELRVGRHFRVAQAGDVTRRRSDVGLQIIRELVAGEKGLMGIISLHAPSMIE